MFLDSIGAKSRSNTLLINGAGLAAGAIDPTSGRPRGLHVRGDDEVSKLETDAYQRRQGRGLQKARS